jgi:hypothetical protein
LGLQDLIELSNIPKVTVHDLGLLKRDIGKWLHKVHIGVLHNFVLELGEAGLEPSPGF